MPMTDLRQRLRTLLPPRCAVCALHVADPVCDACMQDYFALRPRCERCALPLASPGELCGRCLATPPHFDRVTALADYAAPIDGMVMALKFSARLDLADVFGRLLAQRAPTQSGMLVVAVPLAYERMAERGFNQSLQIARAYARAAGAVLDTDAVQRVRHAPPQQTLALAERRRNIRGAFAVTGNVAAKAVCVIDDVMTTGSTMDELARALKHAGAERVEALVVARTP
jgi:ComF family protein